MPPSCAHVLRAHLPPGARAYVFGSRAHGGARRYSDLDLALEWDRPLGLDMIGQIAEALSESDLPLQGRYRRSVDSSTQPSGRASRRTGLPLPAEDRGNPCWAGRSDARYRPSEYPSCRSRRPEQQGHAAVLRHRVGEPVRQVELGWAPPLAITVQCLQRGIAVRRRNRDQTDPGDVEELPDVVPGRPHARWRLRQIASAASNMAIGEVMHPVGAIQAISQGVGIDSRVTMATMAEASMNISSGG